jgi:hypothetical protein
MNRTFLKVLLVAALAEPAPPANPVAWTFDTLG